MIHLLYFVVMAAAMLGLSQVMPGFQLSGFVPALYAALVLALVNTIVKPILFVLTLPLTIVTLGLFLLVLNAIMLWLTAKLVPGFEVQGFGTMVIASLILAAVSMVWKMIVALAAPQAVFRPALIRRLWRYSAGMAFSALAAVLMANADRIALSALLPTAELGKYAVAFTATGLLQIGIQPFYRAFFPRYSELVSAGDAVRLRKEYFWSCQLLAIFIIPLGIIGWTFAPELLSSWLGSQDETVTAVFRWLLIGITCSGLTWLPAAFQQAHGWTRLHASMIAGALVLGTPTMVWAILALGTVGATTVWVLHGISGITLELWLMHRRLLVGELAEWYRRVLLPPLVLTLPLVSLSSWAMPKGLGRWESLGWVGATGFVVIAAALVFGLVMVREDHPLTSEEPGKD